MYCQKCGTELSEGAASCGKCGAVMAKPFDAAISKAPATTSQRLVNYILDRIVIFVLLLIVMALIQPVISKGPQVIISMLFSTAFYVFCELIWQKTPGKLASKTKVVRLDGGKPTFSQILGRSFARLIPFEPFSYLFGAYPMGWHDSLSGTIVVPREYSAADVQNINMAEVKKVKAKNLVVIIIIVFFVMVFIGILSAIVLASLSSARTKAGDARAEATLMSMRAQAEIYSMTTSQDDTANYEGFCSDVNALTLLAEVKNTNGIEPVCFDAKESYAAQAALSTGTYYCVDSTEFKGEVQSALAEGATVCPSL